MADDLDPTITEHFAALDGVTPPDLAARIFGSDLERPVGDGPAPRQRDRSRARVLTVVAASVIVVVGGIVVAALQGRDEDQPTASPAEVSPQPTTDSAQPTQPTSATSVEQTAAVVPFGMATVTPSVVAPGQAITVQPAAEIEPICTNLASVYTHDSGGLAQIGQVSPGGGWFTAIDAAGETIFTAPACGMALSADPITYVIPAELEPGRYVVCLTWEMNEAGCGTFDVDSGAPPTTTAPAAPDPLTSALAEIGADVDGAPAGALTLDGAVWCGVEQAPGPDPAGTYTDEGRRRCLLDAHLAAAPAVLARVRTTTEGDPLVEVWRTLADGTLEVFTDATRDAFGSGRWETQSCGRLTTGFPGPAVVPTTFGCADSADSPVVHTSEPMPEWFTDRAVVPLCGYAIRLTDVDMEQRLCFERAFLDRQPGEFAYLDVYDGVRTARWFRVTSTGEYEVFVQTITEAAPGEPTPIAVWERYACAFITTVDGVGDTYDEMPVFRPEDCAAGPDAEPPPTTTTTIQVTAPPETMTVSPPPTT